MRTVGLFEAKQKLSELVDRASEGQKIGITRRGKLAAMIVPVQSQVSLRDVFQDIEGIRRQAKLPKRTSIRALIEEGRG